MNPHVAFSIPPDGYYSVVSRLTHCSERRHRVSAFVAESCHSKPARGCDISRQQRTPIKEGILWGIRRNIRRSPNGNGAVEQYDAIVIGAGVSGLYQLYKLREMGLSVRTFEDAGGVGGTWYWNRYPGCRFDSESETYGYSWSKELLQEWDWKEHFSGQPENERYLNYVADKFDLRRDIQLNSRVSSAVYDEDAHQWEVQIEGGQRARAQFLVGAVGILSAKYTPPFEGIDSFEGLSFHTSNWPKEKVDFSGKRVGCIGTGATAVQLIPIVAEEAGHLTVFQRTPNYCAPCRQFRGQPGDPGCLEGQL